MELLAEDLAELRGMINDRDVPVNVATRARIILLHAEHRLKKDIVALAGVSLPTVNQWISRYESGARHLQAFS